MARPRKHEEGAQRFAVTLDRDMAVTIKLEALRDGVTPGEVIAARLAQTVSPEPKGAPRKRAAASEQPKVAVHRHDWGDRSKVTGIRRCKVDGCEALDR